MSLLKDYDLLPGDAVLVYTSSLIDRAIQWFSKLHEYKKPDAKVSHVALFLHYDEKGIPIVAEALSHVIVHDGLEYNKTKYTVHVARPKLTLTPEMRSQMEAYCKGKAGEDYSYLQLAAFAFQRIFNLKKVGDWNKSAVVCSEFYCETFDDLFQFKVFPGKVDWDVTPLDIDESPNMVRIAPKPGAK